MSRSRIKLTRDVVATTLATHYAEDQGEFPVLDKSELLGLLSMLQPLSPDDDFGRLTYRLKAHFPDRGLTGEHYSQLAFIDESIEGVLEQVDLDLRIEALIRSMSPAIARLVIEESVFAATRPHPLLSVVDQLCKNCIGWSSDLGILGLQFIEGVDTIVQSLLTTQTDYPRYLGELKSFFAADQHRNRVLESTLCVNGLKQLKENKARRLAVEALNRVMASKKLSLYIVLMLQGPWFMFLQTLAQRAGTGSREWKQAVALARAMIWSLQPIDQSVGDNRQRLRQITTTLPKRIRKFLRFIPFDTREVSKSLGDLEREYVFVKAGRRLEYSDFEMLAVDVQESNQYVVQDPALHEQVRSFKPGQWFLYDDRGQRIARTKLIMKWEEGEQLIFSNQNRRKTLSMNYAELAFHLSSGVVRPLVLTSSCTNRIKSKLHGVIVDHQRQQSKVTKVALVERAEMQDTFIEQRAAKRKGVVKQALQIEHRKKDREERQQQKMLQKVRAANTLVESLNVGAWVKLPIMEGTLTTCRLAAIIAATGNYIFINKAGLKVADYTFDELAQSFISERSEVLDTGAEFEDVLKKIVTGLRANR